MIQFSVVILVLSLVLCNGVDASTATNRPFGITFTPTTIIASRINGSGATELTKRPLGQQYRSIYQDTLQMNASRLFDPQDLTSVSVFEDAIKPITDSLSRQIGHLPEYTALFVPTIFRPSLRDAATKGLLAQENIERAFRQGWAIEATCLGYGFLECRNLDRTPEECNDDRLVNLILVLEYEKDYLYAWLLEVEFELETHPPIHKELCRDCGEQLLQVGQNESAGASVDLKRMLIRIQKLDDREAEEKLNAFLTTFVDEALQKHYLDNPRGNIRSIVVAGEASTEGTKKLGELARGAVATETVRVMTEIDPSEVVAYGAAVWAQRAQQSPQSFISERGSRVDEPADHDEL